MAPAAKEAVHGHVAVLLTLELDFHLGPFVGGLAHALGLGGVLQLVHAHERAMAGALKVVSAHPAAEDVFAAALQFHAGKQTGIMSRVGADAEGIFAGAHVVLARLNSVLEVGPACTVGARGPIDGQLVGAQFLKRRIG